jgi:transcriptional regulator with XRE-family HTH domain
MKKVNVITRLRNETCNMTQRQLASLAGLTMTQMERIENHRAALTMQMAIKLRKIALKHQVDITAQELQEHAEVYLNRKRGKR